MANFINMCKYAKKGFVFSAKNICNITFFIVPMYFGSELKITAPFNDTNITSSKENLKNVEIRYCGSIVMQDKK